MAVIKTWQILGFFLFFCVRNFNNIISLFLFSQSAMTAESVSPPLAAGGGGGGLSPDVMGAAGCGTCCTAGTVGAGTGDRTAGSESAVAVCSCHLAAAASLPPHYASHRSTPATTAVYAPYPSTDQNPYPSIDTSSFYPHLVSSSTI